MCLHWTITGPCFLSPARHLLTVALTRQSPTANAMWQCWDYNIWPVLPGINAITVPHPLRWATLGLTERERQRAGNEKAAWKRREEDDETDKWIWENGRSSLAPAKGRYTFAERTYKHLAINWERWGVFVGFYGISGGCIQGGTVAYCGVATTIE